MFQNFYESFIRVWTFVELVFFNNFSNASYMAISHNKMYMKAVYKPWNLRVLILTYCGLVMPYDDTDLGQRWLR